MFGIKKELKRGEIQGILLLNNDRLTVNKPAWQNGYALLLMRVISIYKVHPEISVYIQNFRSVLNELYYRPTNCWILPEQKCRHPVPNVHHRLSACHHDPFPRDDCLLLPLHVNSPRLHRLLLPVPAWYAYPWLLHGLEHGKFHPYQR